MYPFLKKQAYCCLLSALGFRSCRQGSLFRLDLAHAATKLLGCLQVGTVEQFYTRSMYLLLLCVRERRKRNQILWSWLEGKWFSTTGFPKVPCNPNKSGFDQIPVKAYWYLSHCFNLLLSDRFITPGAPGLSTLLRCGWRGLLEDEISFFSLRNKSNIFSFNEKEFMLSLLGFLNCFLNLYFWARTCVILLELCACGVVNSWKCQFFIAGASLSGSQKSSTAPKLF